MKKRQTSFFPLSWLGLACIVFVLDQLTKNLVSNLFHYFTPVAVGSFFNIFLVHNYGAAFSFLAQANGWQRWFFIGLGLTAVIVIYYLLTRHQHKKLFCAAISLILGGALGNVYDRIIHGYVIDFLDFHLNGWHWPAFNIADSAICLGAALLIIDELRRVHRSK